VTGAPWNAAEFEQQLRERGRAYHIHHPFNVMLNSGQGHPGADSRWVANRFYYQISIPLKDSAILANCDDRGVRRNWVQRILDHDGYGEDPGGIDSWLRLAEAVGLTRAQVESLQQLLQEVRFRGRRLRELRAPCALAGRRVRLAHRAVRAGDPQAAARHLAGALPMDRPGGTEVLPEPGEPGGGATSSSPWP